MVPYLTYCAIRRGLEERAWILVSKLAHVTGRLPHLAGKDHRAFREARAKCHDLRAQLAASRRALQQHRQLHNC
jgi:hypothetical protein